MRQKSLNLFDFVTLWFDFFAGNYTFLVNSAFERNATWSWNSYARTVGTATVVGAINPVSSVRGAATAVGSSFISAWQFRY